MTTFSDQLLRFLIDFPTAPPLPDGVTATNPSYQLVVPDLVHRFGEKFYSDNRQRVGIFGINPGRLGGGLTGIAFTDPTALAGPCQIPNPLSQRAELSSSFIYDVIEELGGPAMFYQHFYLGSVYPLMLLRAGRNYNYYDSAALTATLKPHLLLSLKQQVRQLDLRQDVAICLGKQNALHMNKLNNELKLFHKIIVLDHPRFLKQYKSQNHTANITHYAQTLGNCIIN